jgi:hypothetical protein
LLERLARNNTCALNLCLDRHQIYRKSKVTFCIFEHWMNKRLYWYQPFINPEQN